MIAAKIGCKYWWRHPVAALDIWWNTQRKVVRLDHGPANFCVLIGLMCASLSILLIGPSPASVLTDMSLHLQIAMCGCIFGGCVVKLHGALSHSRFWFPKTALRRCYQLGYTGAPITAAGLFVYGWFIMEHTEDWTSALGACLTPLLGLGVLLQGGVYWLEARRIERVEREMIRIAKRAKGLTQ